MVRAKKSAAAAPATKPFEGFKLALSGKFNAIGYTQSALEPLVKELGGSVGSRVDADTTHLVCTEDDFKAQSTKVAAAQAKDIPILKPDWLLDCSTDKKAHDVDDYLLSQPKNGAASTSDSKADTKADTKTSASVPLRGTKRKADDASGSSKKAPQKKKAVEDKKDVKTDEEEEEEEEKEGEKETKEVADGQFIKRKDVVIPLDSHCPYTDRVVHVDPDSGMIYDAALNQSNSSNNNNKFYRLQVRSHLSPYLQHNLTLITSTDRPHTQERL